MDEPRREAFTHHILLGEVAFQTELAANAAERLPACADEPFDSVEVWSAIQSILAAAANVSKLLWPSPERAARGKALRALLGVDEPNPLSDRKFRNHFEHYDERIEDWMSKCHTTVYSDQKIGPVAFDSSSLPQFVHRHYDPCTKELIFRGETTSIAETLEELKSIRRKCASFVLT